MLTADSSQYSFTIDLTSYFKEINKFQMINENSPRSCSLISVANSRFAESSDKLKSVVHGRFVKGWEQWLKD